jgi:hypothetical protein
MAVETCRNGLDPWILAGTPNAAAISRDLEERRRQWVARRRRAHVADQMRTAEREVPMAAQVREWEEDERRRMDIMWFGGRWGGRPRRRVQRNWSEMTLEG